MYFPEFFFDADIDEAKNVLSVVQHQYIKDIVDANVMLHKDPDNGFTEERSFRRIGSIPINEWHKMGFSKIEDRAERELKMRKYLQENPQYRTVGAIKHDNANDGHIIVK